MSLYARRKQWPLEHVSVRLRHAKVHAADSADRETRVGLLDRIDLEVALEGALGEEERGRGWCDAGGARDSMAWSDVRSARRGARSR